MMKNKKILITGANGGIGISTAKLLLQNNADLVLFYHTNRSQIDKLLNDNPEFTSKVNTCGLDLSDDFTKDNNFISTISNNQIDIFIHSVSLPINYTNFTKLNWNDIQSHIEIQTRSFFNICQYVIPQMQERKNGKIICVLSSYVVGAPPPKMTPYLVGKYSLLGLLKSLAVELGSTGITVNSVSPSMTLTPLIEKLPSKLKEITAIQNPMKKLADPENIASVIFSLCSEHSDYISGENILVTGGQTMH